MSPALQALESAYFNAQQNLNTMLAACKDGDEKKQITTQYVQTRKNYFACIDKAFHDDDPALEALVGQLNHSANELKTINTQLGDIAKVLQIITEAATYGQEIAKEVISL